MSRKSLAKTHDEVYRDLLNRYRIEFGGAVRMEDVGQWIEDNQLLPNPRIVAARVHARKLRQAARRSRFQDAQGRKVRTMVPAKVEKVDRHGNKILEVIWDHLHESSLTHLLTHLRNVTKRLKSRRGPPRQICTVRLIIIPMQWGAPCNLALNLWPTRNRWRRSRSRLQSRRHSSVCHSIRMESMELGLVKKLGARGCYTGKQRPTLAICPAARLRGLLSALAQLLFRVLHSAGLPALKTALAS